MFQISIEFRKRSKLFTASATFFFIFMCVSLNLFDYADPPRVLFDLTLKVRNQTFSFFFRLMYK